VISCRKAVMLNFFKTEGQKLEGEGEPR